MIKKIVFFFIFFHQIIDCQELSIAILSQEKLNTLYKVEEIIDGHGTDAWICKVSDGKNLYIIKQINDQNLAEQVQLIIDTVVSTIGTSLTIQVNKVELIPFNVGANLKKYPTRAATLHEYITGTDLETSLPHFLPKGFVLEQRFRQRKYETIDQFEQIKGFSLSTIINMSYNKSFPALVALDTFTGNYDRNNSNIIFNNDTHSFYGIDQALAYSGNRKNSLPLRADETMRSLSKNNYFKNCSSEIKDGIKTYIETLQNLYTNYPYQKIQSAIKKLIPYLFADQTNIEDLHWTLNSIKINYTNIELLLKTMETISTYL